MTKNFTIATCCLSTIVLCLFSLMFFTSYWCYQLVKQPNPYTIVLITFYLALLTIEVLGIKSSIYVQKAIIRDGLESSFH